MVATMLVYDRLEASDYVDTSEAAISPLVESLRQRIFCVEDPLFTSAYHDPATRFIPNALTVVLEDNTQLREIVVKAPLGHRSRREEAKPEIMKKYRRHLTPHFTDERVEQLIRLGEDREKLEEMDIDQYMNLYVKEDMKWRQ